MGTIAGVLIKLGVTYSRLKAENKELKNDQISQGKDIEEMKDHIRELYDYRLSSSKFMTEVATKLENISCNMNQQFKDMKDMIKEIGEKK